MYGIAFDVLIYNRIVTCVNKLIFGKNNIIVIMLSLEDHDRIIKKLLIILQSVNYEHQSTKLTGENLPFRGALQVNCNNNTLCKFFTKDKPLRLSN